MLSITIDCSKENYPKQNQKFMKHLLTCMVLVIAVGQSVAQKVPLPTCSPTTYTLWADTPYQNSVTMQHFDTKTFYTNVVCGATSYTWTVRGGGSIVTTTPQVTLMGRDLVWLPPGGCAEFNQYWTPYNPWLANPNNNGGFTVNEHYGMFQTTLSVKSDVSDYVTLPITVHNVENCREGSPNWMIPNN